MVLRSLTERLRDTLSSSATLDVDSRTNSANGACGRQERHESEGYRSRLALSGPPGRAPRLPDARPPAPDLTASAPGPSCSVDRIALQEQG
jgi:hypothetical protein